MPNNKSFWLSLLAAVSVGLMIAWVDSQPSWDDSGVTAGLMLLASAGFGFALRQRPWLWAIAVGIWIPAWGVLQTHNYASLLALIVAFVGAFAGAAVRKWSAAIQ